MQNLACCGKPCGAGAHLALFLTAGVGAGRSTNVVATGPKTRATSACCRFSVGVSYTLSNVLAVVPAIDPHSAVEVHASFIKVRALRLKLCVPKRSSGNPSKGCERLRRAFAARSSCNTRAASVSLRW